MDQVQKLTRAKILQKVNEILKIFKCRDKKVSVFTTAAPNSQLTISQREDA